MLNQSRLDDPTAELIDDSDAFWQGYYEGLLNSRYSSIEYSAIAVVAFATFVFGFLLGARWHG